MADGDDVHTSSSYTEKTKYLMSIYCILLFYFSWSETLDLWSGSLTPQNITEFIMVRFFNKEEWQSSYIKRFYKLAIPEMVHQHAQEK